MSGEKVTVHSTHLTCNKWEWLLSSLGAEGDLAHAEIAVMAYSKSMPPGHIMTKANAVCCAPILEETQCSSEPLTWLEILLKKLKLRSCCVVDIFGNCGERIHIIRHVYMYNSCIVMC